MRKFFKDKVAPFFRKIRKHLFASLLLILIVIVSREIYFLFANGYRFPEWTGLASYYDQSGEFHPAKTLWDFLELLIIPIVISIGGFLLNRAEKNREMRIQEQRYKTDLEIAEIRRKQDQENIADQQRSSILQQYLDDIATLLLKENLNKDLNHEAPVIQISRVKTLTALRALENDAKRMRIIFQFLRDSGLAEFLLSNTTFGKINLKYADLDVINLSKSDFRNADLSNAKFYNAQCVETDFSHAILHQASLYHAKLKGADFYQAELIGASLSGADLENATLIGANLKNADLANANLKEADLQLVNFNSARFFSTDCTGANLSQSDFTDANLGEFLLGIKVLSTLKSSTKFINADLSFAKFINADLSLVDLTNANLKNADFTNAKVTSEQLKLAKTLDDATLPNGKKYKNIESLDDL